MGKLSMAVLLMAMVCLVPTLSSAVDFLMDGQFRYGMSYSEADAWLSKNEGDFVIQYRIDTPSTNEIACVYKESEFYRVRFYRGYCFFIERRAEADVSDIPTIFDQFTERYGESPERTQSSDQRLWYGRWIMKDRDIELTAYERHETLYVLTYQEFDPMLLGEALYTQEQEVLGGGSVQIDPITGQPRYVPSEGGDAEAAEDGETAEGDKGEAANGDDEAAEDEEDNDAPPEKIVDDGSDWY